jgi:hypothetical protein
LSEQDDLGPEDTELVGGWDHSGEAPRLDAIDRRIFRLVTRRLVPRGVASGGWEQLYVDPRDGRYWELTFPEGSLHGGGPRRLTCVSESAAREKYGAAAILGESSKKP